MNEQSKKRALVEFPVVYSPQKTKVHRVLQNKITINWRHKFKISTKCYIEQEYFPLAHRFVTSDPKEIQL